MIASIKKKIPDKYKEMGKNAIANFLSFFFPYNLDKLAQLFRTDKWGKHNYTKHYSTYLKGYKLKKIKLLEIGVGGYKYPNKGGNSLRMWKRYFPFGDIFSIDIYDKRNLQEKRIQIFQGDQSDSEFLKEMVNEIGLLDIVIDDGSHINSHVIKSFESLFPCVKDGGLYIIEDLETSYLESYGGDSINLNNPNTSMNFFKSLIDYVNRKDLDISNNKLVNHEHQISGFHFYENLIIIEKRVESNFKKCD